MPVSCSFASPSSPWLPSWVIVSSFLFGLAGCETSPAPGSAAGQLATLYSDATRWCVKQRECKVEAAQCAQRWPDRPTAQAAVSRLPQSQAGACLKAALALDACALKLPCEEFAKFYSLDYCKHEGKLATCCFDKSGAEMPCPRAKCASEEMRFVEQCEALEQLIGDG